MKLRKKVQVSPGEDLTVDVGESGDNRRLGDVGKSGDVRGMIPIRGMRGTRGMEEKQEARGYSFTWRVYWQSYPLFKVYIRKGNWIWQEKMN